MATITEMPELKTGPRIRGFKITKSLIINRPAADLFHVWRNLEQLPRFLRHVVSVTRTSERDSHWVIEGPVGKKMEWDAEIINEHPNEMLAWRTKEGSEIMQAGSVHFQPAPDNRRTEMKVSLEYEMPGGKVGAFLAKLAGKDLSHEIEVDLMRFKTFMEKGEIPSA